MERDPHTGKMSKRNLISLPNGCKPSKLLATKTEAHRIGRGLNCAFILPTPGKRAKRDGELELVATNTFAMARIPIVVHEGKIETPVAIPREALAHAEKLAGRSKGPRFEVLSRHVVPTTDLFHADGVWYELGTEEPPDFEKIEDTQSAKIDTKHYLELGFNPTLLMQVAEAMGSGAVKARLYVDTTQQSQWLNAIEITGLHVRHAGETSGLLMPVRVNV